MTWVFLPPVPVSEKQERTVLCTSNCLSILDTTRTETVRLASSSPKLRSSPRTMFWMKRDMCVSGNASAHHSPLAGAPSLLTEEVDPPEWDAVLAEATDAALGETTGDITRGGVARDIAEGW
jgi:hypothetical protein